MLRCISIRAIAVTMLPCAVQVRGSALDMHDGETRILTLADASILDDAGEIRDDDNVLEDAARAKEAELKRKKQYAPEACSRTSCGAAQTTSRRLCAGVVSFGFITCHVAGMQGFKEAGATL